MNKPELLAPAGNMEKLKMALIYGADAVYIGGEQYGLRAQAGNFTMDEIRRAVSFTHKMNRKLYVTVNIIPHNDDLVGLSAYLKELEEAEVDALIISDPGVLTVAKETIPNMELHLSTQANNTNYKAAEFWYKQGVKRIILARELSFLEIEEIIKKAPKELKFEAFIHGAMCISYSGRCLLSNYIVGRDANRGECAHPCRYKYYLVEEKRPGQYMPIEEDEKGTYIFNSKDLCMIEYIPQLVNSGLKSLKIEGRMKSSYYVATVVRAYRNAIDDYFEDLTNYTLKEEWLEEVKKASHREFFTGFYFNKPDDKGQIYKTSSYIRNYDFVGLLLDYDDKTNLAVVEQRNKMTLGDEIEIMGPKRKMFKQTIKKMWDDENNPIHEAPHPQQIIKMQMEKPVDKYDILRRAIK